MASHSSKGDFSSSLSLLPSLYLETRDLVEITRNTFCSSRQGQIFISITFRVNLIKYLCVLGTFPDECCVCFGFGLHLSVILSLPAAVSGKETLLPLPSFTQPASKSE